MESFSIIGVNCFVLISGYFGIKPSVKGAINFILWCMFYAVGIYTLVAIIKPTSENLSTLFSSFLIFSHTDLWFIPSYFALYIISPIINKGLQNIEKEQYNLLIIGLTFLNVYLGWFWQGNINPTGYNTMQLIYIYVIGKYLRLFINSNKKYRIKYITIYICALTSIFISTFLFKSTMAFAYNSPFVILASVSFFLIFTTFNFHSKVINSIALNAFAVYLIHKMPPIWSTLRDFLYDTSTTWAIIGNVELYDIEQALDVDIGIEEVDTFTGLVFGTLDMIPNDGEQNIELDFKGLHIQILRVEDHQIAFAKVTKLEQNEENPSADD